VLGWIATAYSRQPAAGYPFALRTAAILLFVIALITTITRHTSPSQEEE